MPVIIWCLPGLILWAVWQVMDILSPSRAKAGQNYNLTLGRIGWMLLSMVAGGFAAFVICIMILFRLSEYSNFSFGTIHTSNKPEPVNGKPKIDLAKTDKDDA